MTEKQAAYGNKEPRACRVCGCTEDDCSECIEAQGFPCFWIEDDLCSRCAKEIRAELLSACEAMIEVTGASWRWNGETEKALKKIEAAIARAKIKREITHERNQDG